MRYLLITLLIIQTIDISAMEQGFYESLLELVPKRLTIQAYAKEGKKPGFYMTQEEKTTFRQNFTAHSSYQQIKNTSQENQLTLQILEKEVQNRGLQHFCAVWNISGAIPFALFGVVSASIIPQIDSPYIRYGAYCLDFAFIGYYYWKLKKNWPSISGAVRCLEKGSIASEEIKKLESKRNN